MENKDYSTMRYGDVLVFDIESSGLLDSTTINYLASPYKLRSDYKLWCVVAKNITQDLIYTFEGQEIYQELGKVLTKAGRLIAHNGINFDFMVLKLALGLEYDVEPSSFNGRDMDIVDTLVWSKCLNPDRFGGHSLDEWGQRVGFHKINWRAEAIELGLIKASDPRGAEFQQYHPRMLEYCIRDVEVTELTYKALLEEKGNWPWGDALSLEQRVMYIITQQSHRGFHLDKEGAEEAIRDLDIKMEIKRGIVEPLLPPKKLTKALEKEYTPPKIQEKKSKTGTEVSAAILKFAAKHGGHVDVDKKILHIFGEKHFIPLACVPLIKNTPAKIKDTTHIKEWLVGLGWDPEVWKERDLSVNSKKEKISSEKRVQAIERYVEQTLNSNFCALRCKHLKVRPENLLKFLLNSPEGKPIRVLTNPSFTIGQDKEICPALERMKTTFPYAQDIVDYLTYQHRRNSILGGGFDPDEDDEEDFEKGYLANMRPDGRISTPADTCGAATSRFKHKQVANIPRVTSLYGDIMRGLFGVSEGYVQIGYDFDSLEAKIEAHYTHKYDDENKTYGVALIAEKPHDIHTMTAKRISEIIHKEFSRGNAKSVKYGCVPVENTEVLTREGWKHRDELTLGENVLTYNRELNCYEYTPILSFWDYKGAEVSVLSNKWFSIETTPDHNWINRQRVTRRVNGKRTKSFEVKRTETQHLNRESNIIAAARSAVSSSLTIAEARFLGWLLSDGYYKWSGSTRNKVMGVRVSVDQDESKFLTQVREAIADLFDFKEYSSGTMHSLQPNRDQFRAFLTKLGVEVGVNKHEVNWSAIIAKQGSDTLTAFLEAFWMADGHSRKNGSKVIRQKSGHISDAVALAINMTGNVVYSSVQSDGMLNLSLSNGDTISGQRLRTGDSRTTDVFCISTENESFVMRQNGFITLTGNCTYGAQAEKVSKIIGGSQQEGMLVFDAFWETAYPLRDLKENVDKYWKNIASKAFILGIDNRRVPTRKAHAVINSLFQSAGVICAKRAMVIHDKKLRDAGMMVDFFRDDWKNSKFAQQMIAYHDECQLEVSKDLVKFKVFKFDQSGTEEEIKQKEKECLSMAKKWKHEQEESTGKIFSNVGHRDGVYFVGYCLAGDLAIQSVKEAGEYYKLNVELTAGYDLGMNWGQCH